MDPHARWRHTWSLVGGAPPAGLIEALLAAYGEPQRAYHGVTHLRECFGHLDGCSVTPDDSASLELALWFHDAIYDPKAGDSEARSAAWARAALDGQAPDTLDRIERHILVTRHDAAPTDADQELLLDVDLSILGAAPVRFDQYESQIRREYAWVPDEAYRAARARILAGFCDRPSLYHTAHFRRLLEPRARENLRRSLAALSA